MKKYIFILFLAVIFLISANNSIAQTKEPENDAQESSTESIESKVDLIKDKVASRVAELKLVEKRGMVGVVESVNGNEIRILDLNEKTRIIDTDELTKFSSAQGTFDLTDIKKGTKISAIGLYNKDSGKLLARFVNEISIPIFLNGVISDKDEEEFTISLSTENEKNYTVDIEKITKTFSFSDGELETIGFTKIDNLKNALIIGFVDPKDPERITASRIIIFPDVPKNPRIDISDSETSAPSTSPSKSPSPTPKK